MTKKTPLVAYLDKTPEIPCPYGDVRRVVTAGAGGVANVHIVRITRGGRHFHQAYDETYYLLAGEGSIELGDEKHALRPGAVVVIPAGVPHALEADEGHTLEFVIFGTPPAPIDSEAARPRKI
ncbi:MAG: cupin domain-containing protein [Myxococcales bacterium]|nr:cupin domain-containing protein [Myxococcales bacterium]